MFNGDAPDVRGQYLGLTAGVSRGSKKKSDLEGEVTRSKSCWQG